MTEKSISLSTAHAARVLRLPGKGRIRPGYGADLIAVDSGLNIVHVFARGRPMVRNSQPIAWGTFGRAGPGPPHGTPEAQADIRRHHREQAHTRVASCSKVPPFSSKTRTKGQAHRYRSCSSNLSSFAL
ncbi:amidohydrolase family protein [Kyrpidia tusciae]|uniref:amidohydrolase family protein n=1 Tax=Kyrpidia tusciae TaxID=33943 RepID=UPI00145D38CB